MNTNRNLAHRKGLAPLEFVLWLPVLLFVTALMVNFGTMAAWRVRGQVVSRDAAWRVRTPRDGATEPRPSRRVWPSDAKMDVVEDTPVTSIDVRQIQHPVVRGPLPNGFAVRPTLDPDHRGALRGESSIERTYPMLPRLGEYESGDIENSLLDRRWQVWEMRIASNRSRRVPHIYKLPQASPSFPLAFVQAVRGLLGMANFEALTVLYWDRELARLSGSRYDFYPRIPGRYAYFNPAKTDPKEVYDPYVLRLVDHLDSRGRVELGEISKLPRRMTRTFLAVYQEAVNRWQEQIRNLQQQLDDPSLTAAERQAIQGQIQSLQMQIDIYLPKIQQLEAYQDQLPEIEAELKRKYLEYLDSQV